MPSVIRVAAIIVACVAIPFAPSIVRAQDSIVGDWSGNYRYVGATTRDIDIGIELKIVSVQGSLVTGTVRTIGGSCAGEYQMRGKLDGKNLGMISTNTAGSAGDCKFGFRAVIDGTRMKGTVGTYDMTLTQK